MSSDWIGRKREYARLLRDPRWQRKRLDMLARDQWTCQDCETPRQTLQVHHEWYEDGLLPWEYPDTCYVTLCQPCHKRRTYAMQLEKWAEMEPSDDPPGARDKIKMMQEPLERLARDRGMKKQHWRVWFYMLSCMPTSRRVVVRQSDIAQDLGIQSSDVSRVLKDLAKKGLLEKLLTHQHPATYLINPEYARKGPYV